MRMLTAAAGAALLLLTAAPALAGHRPPPPPACCDAGARPFETSRLNARTYDVSAMRRGRAGGGVVYVDGGYWADFGGHVGPAYHGPVEARGRACPSAPFGYVVNGFGRDDFRPSWCGYRDDRIYDRGGRYGYSERRESTVYESYGSYEAYDAWEEGYVAEDYGRRGDCDCRGDRPPAPYPPPYLPEPPRYEPRHERPRTHRPDRPRRSHPPRQVYRQEPGERG